MKILAIEKEKADVTADDLRPYLKAESQRILDLYEEGVIREIYFHRDNHTAVIILECMDEDEAGNFLQELPLVKTGLIEFETTPLIPYLGFSRLIE